MCSVSENGNEKKSRENFYWTQSGTWTSGHEKIFRSKVDPKVLENPGSENAKY